MPTDKNGRTRQKSQNDRKVVTSPESQFDNTLTVRFNSNGIAAKSLDFFHYFLGILFTAVDIVDNYLLSRSSKLVSNRAADSLRRSCNKRETTMLDVRIQICRVKHYSSDVPVTRHTLRPSFGMSQSSTAFRCSDDSFGVKATFGTNAVLVHTDTISRMVTRVVFMVRWCLSSVLCWCCVVVCWLVFFASGDGSHSDGRFTKM